MSSPMPEAAPQSSPAALTPRRTRNTQQRKAVLGAVQTLAGQHPTAADVFARVREDYPQMSLATVYRAIHALVEQQAITEMRVENVARYDTAPCAHHHVVCRRCGAITDVCTGVLPKAFLRYLETQSGFALDHHPIQVSGLCGNCGGSR